MAYCNNCGREAGDREVFCRFCGAPIEHVRSSGYSNGSSSGYFHSPEEGGRSSGGVNYNQPPYPQERMPERPPYPQQRPDYLPPYPQERLPEGPYTPQGPPPQSYGYGGGESYFDGNGFDLFINNLLLTLVSLLTCGIAVPWMLVRIYQWRLSHTVIEGRRQYFNGTGGQLFGSWIKWWFLTLITCGIYGFYLPVALKKWELSHTSYQGTPEPPSGVYENSWFEGTFGGYIGNAILCELLTIFTCGIGFPWGYNMLARWTMEGQRVEGDRFTYDGTGGGLFGEYIICWFLTLITCGIYSSWATCRINRYVIRHTHLARW